MLPTINKYKIINSPKHALRNSVAKQNNDCMCKRTHYGGQKEKTIRQVASDMISAKMMFRKSWIRFFQINSI